MIFLKKFINSILFIFFVSFLHAETYVDSNINEVQSWNSKKSPYIINDTVTIEKDGFITINDLE